MILCPRCATIFENKADILKKSFVFTGYLIIIMKKIVLLINAAETAVGLTPDRRYIVVNPDHLLIKNLLANIKHFKGVSDVMDARSKSATVLSTAHNSPQSINIIIANGSRIQSAAAEQERLLAGNTISIFQALEAIAFYIAHVFETDTVCLDRYLIADSINNKAPGTEWKQALAMLYSKSPPLEADTFSRNRVPSDNFVLFHQASHRFGSEVLRIYYNTEWRDVKFLLDNRHIYPGNVAIEIFSSNFSNVIETIPGCGNYNPSWYFMLNQMPLDARAMVQYLSGCSPVVKPRSNIKLSLQCISSLEPGYCQYPWQYAHPDLHFEVNKQRVVAIALALSQQKRITATTSMLASCIKADTRPILESTRTAVFELPFDKLLSSYCEWVITGEDEEAKKIVQEAAEKYSRIIVTCCNADVVALSQIDEKTKLRAIAISRKNPISVEGLLQALSKNILEIQATQTIQTSGTSTASREVLELKLPTADILDSAASPDQLFSLRRFEENEAALQNMFKPGKFSVTLHSTTHCSSTWLDRIKRAYIWGKWRLPFVYYSSLGTVFKISQAPRFELLEAQSMVVANKEIQGLNPLLREQDLFLIFDIQFILDYFTAVIEQKPMPWLNQLLKEILSHHRAGFLMSGNILFSERWEIYERHIGKLFTHFRNQQPKHLNDIITTAQNFVRRHDNQKGLASFTATSPSAVQIKTLDDLARLFQGSLELQFKKRSVDVTLEFFPWLSQDFMLFQQPGDHWQQLVQKSRNTSLRLPTYCQMMFEDKQGLLQAYTILHYIGRQMKANPPMVYQYFSAVEQSHKQPLQALMNKFFNTGVGYKSGYLNETHEIIEWVSLSGKETAPLTNWRQAIQAIYDRKPKTLSDWTQILTNSEEWVMLDAEAENGSEDSSASSTNLHVTLPESKSVHAVLRVLVQFARTSGYLMSDTIKKTVAQSQSDDYDFEKQIFEVNKSYLLDLLKQKIFLELPEGSRKIISPEERTAVTFIHSCFAAILFYYQNAIGAPIDFNQLMKTGYIIIEADRMKGGQSLPLSPSREAKSDKALVQKAWNPSIFIEAFEAASLYKALLETRSERSEFYESAIGQYSRIPPVQIGSLLERLNSLWDKTKPALTQLNLAKDLLHFLK